MLRLNLGSCSVGGYTISKGGSLLYLLRIVDVSSNATISAFTVAEATKLRDDLSKFIEGKAIQEIEDEH